MIKVNQHLEPKQIITADLYKGSIIEKAFAGGDEGLISAEIIRIQLKNKLEKGLIDQPLYDKAIEQLDSILEKGGEGSKGGHIIGHTKSGKPVYKGKDQASAKEYKDFSAQDHDDAAEIHNKEAYQHNQKGSQSTHAEHARFHSAMMQHHRDSASSHQEAAHKQIQKEHESSLSNDEKKILADKKKKDQSFHLDMAEHHSAQIRSLEELKKKHNHPDIDQEIRMHESRKDSHSIAHNKLMRGE